MWPEAIAQSPNSPCYQHSCWECQSWVHAAPCIRGTLKTWIQKAKKWSTAVRSMSVHIGAHNVAQSCLCWWMFCPLDKRHRNLSWDKASTRLACGQLCWTFSWLMFDVGDTHANTHTYAQTVASATPGQVVLNGRRAHTEQVMGSEPASSIPP